MYSAANARMRVKRPATETECYDMLYMKTCTSRAASTIKCCYR